MFLFEWAVWKETCHNHSELRFDRLFWVSSFPLRHQRLPIYSMQVFLNTSYYIMYSTTRLGDMPLWSHGHDLFCEVAYGEPVPTAVCCSVLKHSRRLKSSKYLLTVARKTHRFYYACVVLCYNATPLGQKSHSKLCTRNSRGSKCNWSIWDKTLSVLQGNASNFEREQLCRMFGPAPN